MAALSENAKTMVKIIQDALLEDPATVINMALLHAMQAHLHVTDPEMDEITRMFLAGAASEMSRASQWHDGEFANSIISRELQKMEGEKKPE